VVVEQNDEAGQSAFPPFPLAPEYKTLSGQAFAALHSAVLAGTLAPGRRLPITELATALKMSPMPVREALHQLDAVGLVEHIPHRGARVTQLSVEDLRGLYEARLALEPLAVRAAAVSFTPEQTLEAAAELRILQQAYRDGDANTAWLAHTGFHFQLYAAAESRWLERLIRPLWESSERYRRVSAVGRGLRERHEEHVAILSACAERDGSKAAAVLHDHLARTANLIAREMGAVDMFALIDESHGSLGDRDPENTSPEFDQVS